MIGSALVAHALMVGPLAELEAQYLFLLLAFPLVLLKRLSSRGIYGLALFELRPKRYRYLASLILTSFGLLAALLFLAGAGSRVENEWLLLWTVLSTTGLLLTRATICRQVASRPELNEKMSTRVAILGAGPMGQQAARMIDELQGSRVRLVGVFDDRSYPTRDQADGEPSYPPIGSSDQLLNFARTEQIDVILVAIPTSANERVRQLVDKLRVLPVEIDLCLGDLVWSAEKATYQLLNGIPVLSVVRSPLGPWEVLQKRVMDLTLITLAAPILLPLMLLVALAIKLDSKGPLFFPQARGGFNLRPFTMWKFRSMYDEGGSAPFSPATPNDPRVTRVGRFIRRYSLDELPQLFNVLKGDLSLVGPRPHAISMDEAYARLFQNYVGRNRVKPGVTGLAQINGARGLTDTPAKISRRLEYDLQYVDHWSLWLDLKILLKTLRAVLVGENAY